MKFFLKTFLALTASIALLYIFSAPLFNCAGRVLVKSDEIKPSDFIVILAGDPTGDRLGGAIKLWKKGYARQIIFWSGDKEYTRKTIARLKEIQVEENQIIFSESPLTENSTYGEALANIKLLKQAKAQSFILVTADYHTARSGRIYASLAKKNGLTLCVYPVQTREVSLDKWWINPVNRKKVLREWQKTIWYFFKYAD